MKRWIRIFFFKLSLIEVFNFFILKLLGLETIGYIKLKEVRFTWPHKVSIGYNTIIEHEVFFKHDGPYSDGKSIIIKNNVFIGSGCEFNIRKKIFIGDDSLIASGCKFIDHNHGLFKNKLIREQKGPEEEIHIKSNVWLGANVIILKGVVVNDGAVVAAGSVVTKSIPAEEIWAGIPAKKIGVRN
ncbi:acyltransferase [Pedobacter sp. SD-b]|uniref:Acyltransferase n=1 Tax=Pedobacter segetis TaxID=2793069 RepID=A0ABS1BGR7_9SPHI|nr:acyltransferase [Pedobacter segetis]MBK0382066.1 acyltransferase [Pedobacter segetis]